MCRRITGGGNAKYQRGNVYPRFSLIPYPRNENRKGKKPKGRVKK